MRKILESFYSRGQSLPWTRTFAGVLAIVGFATSIFFAIGSLTWPFGRDQGIFAWAGEVILNGGVPYRDAWDIKGPLTHYAYAFALGLLGNREISIRVLDLLALTATAWSLRRLTLRLTGGDAYGANFAVIFFVLGYYGGGFWHTAQPDGWGGMLILGVVVQLLEPSLKPYRTAAVAGILVGLATLFKPTFLIFLLLPICSPDDGSHIKSTRIALVATTALSFAALLTVVFLTLYFASDGLGDYADVLRFISQSYLPPRHFIDESTKFFSSLFFVGLLIPTLLAPIGLWVLRRQQTRRQLHVLTLWLVLTLLLVIAQGRYFTYQWIPSLIAVTPPFGIAATYIGQRWVTSVPRTLRTAALAIAVGVSVFSPWKAPGLLHSSEWPRYVFGFEDRASYVGHMTAPWRYVTYAKLSSYIQNHSGADDLVVLWGFDTVVNLLSDRRSPTRFGVSYPLAVEGPLRARYRGLFMSELSGSPPRYIILDVQQPWALVDKSGREILDGFPAFNQFLLQHYRLVEEIDGFQILIWVT